MPPTTKLSSAAKTYIGVVIVAGSQPCAFGCGDIRLTTPERVEVLAALTLLTGSLTLKIPTVSARLSVSEVFVFAAVLWFGPGVATFLVVLDTLVGTLWLRGRNRTATRTFSTCPRAPWQSG